MVLSKINKKIKYTEFKKINNDDLNRETDLYEIVIKKIPVIIAIGIQDNSYITDGVIFFPIYLIKYNMKSIQIGVFEVSSETEDIETNDPLFYSFVTKEFLEKIRLNPNRIDEIEKRIDLDETVSKKEAREVKETREVKQAQEVKEVKQAQEVKEISIGNEKEVKIQNIRKPYFSQFSERMLSPLPEETEKTRELRDQEFTKVNWVQKFFHNKEYALKDNEGGGDCFFYAIRDAFMGLGHETSVAKLREIVVANASEEKFLYYKELYNEYSSTATELKEKAKKLKISYEEIQQRLKEEPDKVSKIALLKKGKEIKEERNNVIEEYDSLQTLIRDVKFISNVPDFKHFKSKLRTSHYFADSWTIGIIEKVLNIKCIILSSDHYENGDMESVVNCAITDISQLIDGTEIENFYEPDFYIILDHTGTHYKLITYKNRRIFTFKELPYDLRHIIVNKCMERRNIFNYIPEFIQMKGEVAKGRSFDPDKIQQLCDARLYDLFDENIEFLYYSKSRDGIPGKSNGEKIPLNEVKHFLKLNKIKNWRKKLSNDWIEPFEYDKHKWASVTHLYEASKYKSNPKKYIQYSLDSGSDLSKNIDLVKKQKEKIDKNFINIKNQILQDALLAKWSHPELKELLLETKKAKLSEFKRGEEPEVSCILMDVRDKLSKE